MRNILSVLLLLSVGVTFHNFINFENKQADKNNC